ncbi:MAG: hypothetical protein ACLRX5_00560 [Slackia sp.]
MQRVPLSRAGSRRLRVRRALGANFVDENGDGVCDHAETGNGNCSGYVDEDGDGACDNAGSCAGSGQGAGYGRGHGPATAAGITACVHARARCL